MADVARQLEAKRAKLAELQKQRKAAELATAEARIVATAAVTSPQNGTRPEDDAADVDKILSSVLGPASSPTSAASQPTAPATAAAPGPAKTSVSTSTQSTSTPTINPAAPVTSSAPAPLTTPLTPSVVVVAPPKPIVYDKDTQVDLSLLAKSDEEKKRAAWEEDVRSEVEEERMKLARREEELKQLLAEAQEERKKWEAKNGGNDSVPEKKPLSASERARIQESAEFNSFFSRSARIMERALGSYDPTIVYEEDGILASATDKTIERVTQRHVFGIDGVARGPVTSMAWSPKYPELVLAAYGKQEDAGDVDGHVIVWNLHLSSRPEYQFTSSSTVLSAQFHPVNPKWLLGGTWGGQVVIWDTKKKTPMNRTSLSKGHTQPVFTVRTHTTPGRAPQIVSLSTDGHLCVWSDNNLHEPTLEREIRSNGKNDDITTTCFAFAGKDGGTYVMGSDEGKIYKARVHDEKVAAIYEEIKAHDAPIAAIEWHPGQPKTPVNLSELYLTCSYDWTVRLWSLRSPHALFTFEGAKDYVYDVQWSPVHPALFASCDGTGRVDIWDLSVDTEVPVHTVRVTAANITVASSPTNAGSANGSSSTSSTPVGTPSQTSSVLLGDDHEEKEGPACSRLRWSDDGLSLAVGTSSGHVIVFGINESLALPTKDTATNFSQRVTKALVPTA